MFMTSIPSPFSGLLCNLFASLSNTLFVNNPVVMKNDAQPERCVEIEDSIGLVDIVGERRLDADTGLSIRGAD